MIYTIVFIIFIGFIVYAFVLMRPRTVKQIPLHWHAILLDKVLFYKKLSKANQDVFKKRIALFLTEINIDGVNTTIDETDKLLIASSAIIPVF